MNKNFKRRDGFEGEKLISLPQSLWRTTIEKDPALFQLYITDIGYFPKANFHYRERKKGCNENILIYCLQGKGHYMVSDKQFEVQPNQFFLLPATDEYLRYWADTEDPWTIYWIHFNGQQLECFNQSLNIHSAKGPVSIPFNEKALILWNDIFDTLEMGYSRENLCNASFCLHHLLSTFLFPDRNAIQKTDQKADVVTETILNMRKNLYKKLTVKEMADLQQLSSSHFSILFRQATGMPPIDYFTHLKMQKACQLLNANGSKIKEVALILGYDDPYYFSRVFKNNMGLSPEQYRLSGKRENASSHKSHHTQ